MEALGGRVPAGQVQDSRSLFRQGRASLASTGGPKRLALLEVTTCTATSGLGHASSAKPWRACSRQVRDSGLTTRTRPSSAQACSEKGLTLHLLDVVPENDIRKARPAQSIVECNAVCACRLERRRGRGGTTGSRSASEAGRRKGEGAIRGSVRCRPCIRRNRCGRRAVMPRTRKRKHRSASGEPGEVGR